MAVDHGADAVIVSNHGGNALDGTPATLRVLPEVLDAVGDRTEVLDRRRHPSRGGDVVKALAIGARAVLVGSRVRVGARRRVGRRASPTSSRCSAPGIDRTLALLGCPSIDDLDPSYLRLPPWAGG